MDEQGKVLKQVGHAIRTARSELGLSQEQLAVKAGLDRTYIGGVERGERNLGIYNLYRIAYALKVSVASLVQGLNLSEESKNVQKRKTPHGR